MSAAYACAADGSRSAGHANGNNARVYGAITTSLLCTRCDNVILTICSEHRCGDGRMRMPPQSSLGSKWNSQCLPAYARCASHPSRHGAETTIAFLVIAVRMHEVV